MYDSMSYLSLFLSFTLSCQFLLEAKKVRLLPYLRKTRVIEVGVNLIYIFKIASKKYSSLLGHINIPFETTICQLQQFII